MRKLRNEGYGEAVMGVRIRKTKPSQENETIAGVWRMPGMRRQWLIHVELVTEIRVQHLIRGKEMKCGHV